MYNSRDLKAATIIFLVAMITARICGSKNRFWSISSSSSEEAGKVIEIPGSRRL